MSSKKPSDQINKAAWTLTEGIKDAVSANVRIAISTKQVKVDNDQLSKILAIIDASIDEGYHRGSRVFSRVVDAAIDQAAMPQLTASSTPPTKKKTS